METAQKEAAVPPAPELTEFEPSENEWIIRRPKRAVLTAEESIRRTEDFINNPKRQETFIAAIRKSKS